MWNECKVPLNACVIRYWNRKKNALDHIVLVTTDQRLKGPWIVRHYEERPEIEQDYEQMKSGGGQPQKTSSNRSTGSWFFILTLGCSYRRCPLFAHTQTRAQLLGTMRAA